MKKFTNQFNVSHADRMNYGGAKFCRFALFPLMLFMLLFVPTRMVAQTEYDKTVTLTALAGNPEGYDNEKYGNLVDGNNTKWCCKFDSNKGAYVIFEASKAGVPVGYTITTGDDNETWGAGRNPKSWKLYGNNEGENGAWTLIQAVENDTKLQDKNCTSYDFTCEGSTSYKYFKWEISAIHSGSTLQVGEFELKLNTCSHKQDDGSSAFGEVKTVETTCTEHGYTTKECSICHLIVKEYLNDELKKHTLTHHEAKDEVKEHWQCDVCHKYFCDANATQEVNYASLIYKGYAVFDEGTGTLTFKYGTSPEEAYDLNVKEWEHPGWESQRKNIKKVVFDASFANARPTICDYWFNECEKLTDIEGIEYLNTEKVTSMESMFRLCEALTSLDLTNFNTTNVTSMHLMFDACFALTTIYVSDKFVTTNVTSSSNMFWGCKKLKGYDRNKVDHYYAHCGTDGYFTPGCAYAEFDNATGTLTFRYKGVKPEGAYYLNRGTFDPGWLAQKEKIKKVVFDASFANARPTSCYYWFGKCSNLTTIEGIEYLNTENVTNMCYMFGSSSLTSLDLTKFNTEKVEDMKYMFYRCSALTTIFASDKFVTSKVRFGYDMFTDCKKLIGAIKYDGSNTNNKDFANYKTGYFTPEGGFPGYAKFDEGTGTLTFTSGPSKPAGAYELNVETNNPGWLTQTDYIKKVVFDASFASARPTSCFKWFSDCSKLTNIEGIENLKTEKVTVMNAMFKNCSSLTSLDLSNFNTAKVKDMYRMFSYCSTLTTIYASNKFVTDKVVDGSEMFNGCNKLIGAIKYDESKIDHHYANYDTGYFSRPAYAEFDNSTGTLTFKCGLSKPAGAYGLNEGRNLPDWNNLGTNVKKVVFDASFASARPTNCYGWFKDFTNLTTIEGFEYLNTENVTNMTGVFNGCSALTSLDLTNFNTAKVTDMKLLFANCSALESLDLSMFNTENVTSMPSMFNGATKLKTLNVSNFNTEKVNNMGHMFANCPNLTSLDLSSFNTKGVEYVDNIFKNCSNLTTIYASENFAFGSGLKNGADMFLGCDKLKGFIEYNKNTDTDKNNSEFANYKTGYFTKLVGKNGDEKIGAVGEILTAENLTLNDDKDFVAYEKFAAKDATYSREMKTGTTWGTLCLPFAIDQSQETGCKFYSLTGIDNVNDCITLESYEEGAKIPAGTPVLFKMNEGVQTLSISAQNAELVKEPVAGTNTDVNLVGSFTKIGGKDNQGLDKNDYIISKNKFWRVSDLTGGKGVGSKPMHAYIHPATASQARAAMLSIGKGDGTTAIDNLNAISNDANAEYYDANGRRTNGLQKGLNIVKRGSKTYKIMVK